MATAGAGGSQGTIASPSATSVTGRRPGRGSIRWRIGGWTVAIFTATLAASTAIRIADERRRTVDRETRGALALLDRLSHTPEVARSLADARSLLAVLEPALEAENARIALTRESEPPPSDGILLATREMRFPEGPLELRYILGRARLAATARRAVLFHVAHAALTLLLLLAGMEWILRRRLLAPLRQLSHQVAYMGSGGGWEPVLPEMDDEIVEIRTAVRDLGPSLAGQVDVWMEGEKGAVVALALARLRERLRSPQRRALVLLSDLQAMGSLTPSGKAKARALTREMEAISRIIDETEAEHLPLRTPTMQGPEARRDIARDAKEPA
ncbi:MAG TPA: hypothetical protein VMK42_10615 [Anaeromyxobacteraceae bacterium]|nr:hypothetical protein [Anaeromyxobacteraceae bacterium]